MPEIKRIPFSFCRIKRAAEFLDVHTDDLLSLASSGKISLCLRLDGMHSYLLMNNDIAECNEWFSSLDNENDMTVSKKITPFSSFSIENLSSGKGGDLIVEPRFLPRFYGVDDSGGAVPGQCLSNNGKAYGLWVLLGHTIKNILNTGNASMDYVYLMPCGVGVETPVEVLAPKVSFYNANDGYDDEYSHEEPPKITADDLWITSGQVRLLLDYQRDWSELPDIMYDAEGGVKNFPMNNLAFNPMVEHHAKNRELLFKSAIYILSKYPDECRGERKLISPEKWMECILSHKNEIPPLMINNKDVILKHIRAAVNGKLNS